MHWQVDELIKIVVDCGLKPGLNSGGKELQVLAGFSAFKRFARKQSLIPSNAHPSSMASARPLGELLFDMASRCQLFIRFPLAEAFVGLFLASTENSSPFWGLIVLSCSCFLASSKKQRFQIWNYKKYMPNTYDYRRVSAGSCCGCMGYNYSSFDRQGSDSIRTCVFS